MNIESTNLRGMPWTFLGVVLGWMLTGLACNASDVTEAPGGRADAADQTDSGTPYTVRDGSGDGTGGETATDGGLDGSVSTDLGPSSDARADTTAVPNRCSPQYRELVNASGPSPRVRAVPWQMLSGGAPSYRKKTIVAEWRGVRDLESSVQFDCPPTAGQTGLKCQTDRGLFFEHSTSGSGRTLIFALGIPVDRIDFPEPGTDVRLTYFAGDQFSAFEMRLERKTDPVVALRAAESDSGSDDQYGSPEQFRNTYPSFEVEMKAPIDRPGSALCLVTDHCDRLLRIEPLTVRATKTRRISPGESPRFEVAQQSYRFWHLVSFRRNQMLGPESSCADVTYPAASYAVARLK